MSTEALVWMLLVQSIVTGICITLMIKVLRTGKKSANAGDKQEQDSENPQEE